MSEPSSETQQFDLMDLNVIGVEEESCKSALEIAIGILTEKLPLEIKHLVIGTTIIIADGIIDGGGLTKVEERKIILDATKNKLSLEDAEHFLVSAGFLNDGDWTAALPQIKSQPWSCLTYQLVHEFGHLIDGLSEGDTYNRLSPEFSPTKYGISSSTEAFAEAFAYWTFGLKLASAASQTVTESLLL